MLTTILSINQYKYLKTKKEKAVNGLPTSDKQ